QVFCYGISRSQFKHAFQSVCRYKVSHVGNKIQGKPLQGLNLPKTITNGNIPDQYIIKDMIQDLVDPLFHEFGKSTCIKIVCQRIHGWLQLVKLIELFVRKWKKFFGYLPARQFS